MSIKELLRIQYHRCHEDFKIIFWASLIYFIFIFVSISKTANFFEILVSVEHAQRNKKRNCGE